MVKNQGERWWNKVEQRHERSGIGSLVRAEDLYLSPWELQDSIRAYTGCDLDQLGAVDVLEADRSDASEIEFATRPTHALSRVDSGADRSVESADAERGAGADCGAEPGRSGAAGRVAAGVWRGLSPRLAGRPGAGSTTVYSESSYLAGDLRTPVIVRAAIANGVQVLDLDRSDGAAGCSSFGANDINDDADVMARPARRKSKTAAFVSDFRDLAVGDYVVHVEHGIARY